jgi:hypothetical protein
MIPCGRTDLVLAETPTNPKRVLPIVGFDAETGIPWAVNLGEDNRAQPGPEIWPDGYYILQAIQMPTAPPPGPWDPNPNGLPDLRKLR